MKDNEAENVGEESLSITDALKELWDRASNPSLTTSQKIQAVDPEAAERYRMQKEIRDAVLQIRADLKKEKQERDTTKAAMKRGVMQIIKAIWPD